MRKIISGLSVLVLLLISFFTTAAMAQGDYSVSPLFKDKKILVAYFSHTGNTKDMADHIQNILGSDIVEIAPAKKYTQNYNQLLKQAKEELHSKYLPPLNMQAVDVASYDIIFIGSPNWYNTIAPPVWSFLSAHDFKDKIIIPFMTHGGTAMGRASLDIEDLCPNSTVLTGLALRGNSVKTSRNDVYFWLSRTDIAKEEKN